jgi:ubiquinone/menaquinone biosynthesis C-methylase UbiE
MPSWEIYSYFYSLSLRNLFPYRDLLEDLNRALDVKEDERILDAGCGPGLVIEKIARANEGKRINITGLDSSERMIGQAHSRCKDLGVRLHVADLNKNLEFPESSFDKVVCSNTLYALASPRAAISEFHRVIKQGGALVIANPKPNANQKEIIRAHMAATNRTTPVYRRTYYIATSILLIPVNLAVMAINKAILEKGKNREYHFLDKPELESVLWQAGFKSVRTSSCYAGQNWLVRAEK